MNTFDELDYYQILEVETDASFSSIRQAYQDALSLYLEDTIVSDAFFSDTEKEQIIEEIEQAFSVLYDKDKRKAYDRYCGIEHVPMDSNSFMGFDEANNNEQGDSKVNTPEPIFSDNRPVNRTEIMTRIKEISLTQEVKALAEDISAKENISGKDIRKLRKSLGLTVDKVYEITRVSASTIRQIENDEFESLPPTVYLKGFLTSYAEVLHLPSETIINGYLSSMTSS